MDYILKMPKGIPKSGINKEQFKKGKNNSGKNNGMYGRKASLETRKKMSENHRMYNSEETKMKMSLASKGKPKSKSHCKNISISKMGNQNAKGWIPSQKTRKIWSIIRKGKSPWNKDLTKEIDDRLIMSDETKRKLKDKRKLRVLPKKDTTIEVKIQNFLKELDIEFFTHQYMKIEHGYQCDILIPEQMIVIEADGNYWHEYPIGREIDHIRTKEMETQGYKVIRLWEVDIRRMNLEDFKEELKLNYLEETKRAMTILGQKEDTIFLGQTCLYSGSPMFKSLEGVPKEKRIELPLIEDLQAGMSLGLSLENYKPISIYPRIDFSLCACNQIINHIDHCYEMSNKEFNPIVIIRTQIGNIYPLHPGIQHCGDYTKGFKAMCKNINVIKLEKEEDIVPAYIKAYNSNKSTLFIETPQGGKDPNQYKK